MASSISTKPFFTPSRTDSLSSFLSPNSNLRSLSSVYLRPRFPKKQLHIRAAGSTYGNHFRVTTYGESHGGGVGCVIDGCPPRIPLSEADMQEDLDRRRPGQSRITTPRKETDTCKIFSGVSEGVTTGTPIHVFVPNTDQRGNDYSEMSLAYRPSHADATYDMKYGVRSVQGGGRSSARETIGRVASGAVAKKILKNFAGTEILAYVSQVHKIILPEDLIDHETLTLDQIESILFDVQTLNMQRR
uniref:Chorismate synthase n=1 Tax=Medicago truncatula TaxID=3880 RepID=I3T6H0_MEDTR|nr:unknown [Medicago truncatula]